MNGTGLAVVEGQEWTARLINGEANRKGTKVIVEEISGVKLMVKIKRR